MERWRTGPKRKRTDQEAAVRLALCTFAPAAQTTALAVRSGVTEHTALNILMASIALESCGQHIVQHIEGRPQATAVAVVDLADTVGLARRRPVLVSRFYR